MEIYDILTKLEILKREINEEKAKKDYDKDGKIESPEKEHAGAVDNAIKKSKTNEDIESVLRKIYAIQEQTVEEDDVEEGNEFANKVNQLKAQGAKPGTKFKTSDGQEHVLESDEQGVAEAGVKQLPTQGADYSKYDTDTLKMMLRPGILHRNEARFKALIRKELQKREQQGVAEGRYKPPKNTYYVMQTSINSDEGRSVDVFDLMYNGKIIKRYNLLASADRQLRRLRAAGNPVQMENEQGVAEVSLEECDMSPLSMPAAMQQEQSPDRYTLNIQRGDKSLNVTTDSPDELLNIMKLAGINSQSVVAQRPAEESNMHEEWENTPIQTNEREPRAYGDIRDWGFKGTGKGKPGSALNRPAGQGDNPLGETAMMEEYKQFKSGK